jgi:hypothetical protein
MGWIGQDLMTNTMSGLTTILNTVAPPIGAHETLELWLSHSMIGYDGVEGVVYRAWTRVLEQTESGELVVVWSPEGEVDGKEGIEGKQRGIYPVQGWTEGCEKAGKGLEGIKAREEAKPQGRAKANRESNHVRGLSSLRINSECTSDDSAHILTPSTTTCAFAIPRTTGSHQI